MRLALPIFAILLSTSQVFAAAVTYEGVLGGVPIVAEITEPQDGAVVGRFFYRSYGGDVPLQARRADGNFWSLSEEAPCLPGACATAADDDDAQARPPLAATWLLTRSADGQHISGGRKPAGKSAGRLAIELERVAQRALPVAATVTPDTLRNTALMAADDRSLSFTSEALPYDMLKMDVALDTGPVQTVAGASFQYVVDPRTKFAFPRVVALPDGSDTAPINRALASEHARLNAAAFQCLSAGYAGFGWNDAMGPAPADSLGWYDEAQLRVTYLSPTVMSWVAAGSSFCGGPGPQHYSTSHNYDVVAGAPLALSKIFKGWRTGERGGAPAELIDWLVNEVATVQSPGMDQDCPLKDLIAEHLAIRFETGDTVVFTLEGLPSAISACQRDIKSARLADIATMLAPGAANYFPALTMK
ncbi:hypothetical protein [uncultured Devosia sp.]|uniref:hypothetical protein n=1 Tax=uncultured Devosia sp. TaxID=211434 RepID=UPI0035CAA43A